MHRVERALFDLMSGQPLYVTAGSESGTEAVLVAAVEGLSPGTVADLRRLGGGAALRLAITDSRARVMGLPAELSRQNGTPPVTRSAAGADGSRSRAYSLLLGSGSTADEILGLATSVGRNAGPLLEVTDSSRPEAAALALARVGRLLPAVVCVRVASDEVPELAAALGTSAILEVSASEIELMAYGPGLDVVRVTEAPVPLGQAEDAHFILFREAGGLFEHVAVLIGDRAAWPDPLPVRLHSACLTGDLFGSLRCDCGEQLRGSLRVFAERGGGILLYLAQEGRGIGLGNKLRAYALQQEGLDTVDADCTLGFDADERTYEVGVQMLRDLGVQRVELLTNNPDKVHALERGGIEVVERSPLHGTLNRHNLPYVSAKVHRAGHWLEGMLSMRMPKG
jgi:GTP cyclohydrolase II